MTRLFLHDAAPFTRDPAPTRYITKKVRFASLIITILLLSACRTPPDYPIPDQAPSFESFKLHAVRVVDMSQPSATSHIVRDILSDTGAPWRWTLQRPAVQVRVGLDTNLSYVIDFVIPIATFKDTGPVTIAFTVNDRILDHVRYAAPGPQHFQERVPGDWLQPHTDAIAGAEIDKIWISKDDGARLGFIISRIGLVEQ